jgi:hypothetical protein
LKKLFSIALFLLTAFPSFAAVGFDAIMTAGNAGTGNDTLSCNGVGTCSGTPITVGASATGLVVSVNVHPNGNVPTSVSVTCTWNAVSMTIHSSITDAGHNLIAFFVLANPATGAKTLSCNDSTAGTTLDQYYIGAVSFTGTDTSTVVKATDDTTASATTQITVTSDANGASVAVYSASSGTPTMNFTRFFDDSALANGAGGTYNLGGTSNVHTFTGQGNGILAGVHVIAAAATGANPNLTIGGKAIVGGAVVANK